MGSEFFLRVNNRLKGALVFMFISHFTLLTEVKCSRKFSCSSMDAFTSILKVTSDHHFKEAKILFKASDKFKLVVIHVPTRLRRMLVAQGA